MKITIVMGPFLPPPPGAAGAVERRWAGSAVRMADRGHEVTIVCRGLDDASDHPAEPWTTDAVTYRVIRGYGRSGRMSRDLLRDFRYSRRAMHVLPKADVTVVNTFWLPILLPKAKDKRHGAVIYNLARFPKQQLRWYAGVDRILAVSNAVAEAAIELVPSLAAKVTVVPNPIDVDAFSPQPFYGIPETPRVLYTGRLHPEKGLHLLIEACRRILEGGRLVRLCLRGEHRIGWGGGGEPYLDELRALAKPLGAYFEIAAPLYDRKALAGEIAACDLYVCPSIAEKGESFGVAPLEAMAVGRPVIVSRLACFNEIAKDGDNALVFDHRADDPGRELSESMLRLIESPELAGRIAHRAAESARGFDYDSVVDQYLAVFADAAAEKAS